MGKNISDEISHAANGTTVHILKLGTLSLILKSVKCYWIWLVYKERGTLSKENNEFPQNLKMIYAPLLSKPTTDSDDH